MISREKTLQKDFKLRKFIEWLFVNISDFIIPPFHCLLKVHKLNNLTNLDNANGRPIVGNYKAPLTNASKYMAFLLQPILENTPTYLKNSFELINILEGKFFTSDFPVFVITGDVQEMYPSIPLKEAITINVVDRLYKYINNNDFLTHKQFYNLLEMILYCNVLYFNNEFYLQEEGLPMGSSCSPQIASLFLWNLERNVPNYFYNYILLWKRFIDDVFIIWNGPKVILNKFLEWYNSLHYKIKISWKISDNYVDFLDITVCVDYKNLSFYVKTFQKPINNYMYVLIQNIPLMSKKVL